MPSKSVSTSINRPVPRIALSRAEVALAIGVSTNSVDLMVKEGTLPKPRKWHTRKIWIVAEIEASMFNWPVDGEEEAEDWTASNDVPPAAAAARKIVDGKRSTKAEESYALFLQLGAEGFREHYKERHREWAANLPNEPLNKLERLALEQLARHGVGVPVNSRDVKKLGPGTEERLKLRGFIGNNFRKKFPDRVQDYWITEAGIEAWENLKYGD